MKNSVIILILALAVVCLSGCGTTFSEIEFAGDSDIYSKKDIREAMDIVREEIEKSENYILLELKYDEEFSNRMIKYYKEQYGADEVIVLRSKFFVSKKTEGALEKGETAKWSWILIRNEGGSWELKDAGYP